VGTFATGFMLVAAFPTRPVIRPIRTMGLDEVLSLFRTVDEAVAA
jgi:anti-sigma B factor antagonist